MRVSIVSILWSRRLRRQWPRDLLRQPVLWLRPLMSSTLNSWLYVFYLLLLFIQFTDFFIIIVFFCIIYLIFWTYILYHLYFLYSFVLSLSVILIEFYNWLNNKDLKINICDTHLEGPLISMNMYHLERTPESYKSIIWTVKNGHNLITIVIKSCTFYFV